MSFLLSALELTLHLRIVEFKFLLVLQLKLLVNNLFKLPPNPINLADHLPLLIRQILSRLQGLDIKELPIVIIAQI
jgi:hypothetical protein